MTVRERPLPQAVSAGGGVVVRGESFIVESGARVELVDLTDRLMAIVRRSGIAEGLASVWSMHTTAALFINESQPALSSDILTFLEEIAARDRYYRHNDPDHSDCERTNADSHLRAMLLGHSLALQVSGGDLVLGCWQRVLLAELDGPRPRDVRVQLLGVAA